MRKRWTKEEEEYLEKKYASQPIETTARRLHRTVNSCAMKASKMGLTHYQEYLTASELAKCFNSDPKVVVRWINKFDMPARKIKAYKNVNHYEIDPIKFWEWAENNKEIINWSKYEIGSLLPEPEWVMKAKIEFKTPKHRTRFTDLEKNQIKAMMTRGISYKDIAIELGRTHDSIMHVGRTIFME